VIFGAVAIVRVGDVVEPEWNTWFVDGECYLRAIELDPQFLFAGRYRQKQGLITEAREGGPTTGGLHRLIERDGERAGGDRQSLGP
jgi:hypothetical protein